MPLGVAESGPAHPIVISILRTMARLFRLEGRYVEVSEVLTAAWAGAPNPSELLQDLWQNDTEPVPIDGWKVFLDTPIRTTIGSGCGRARHAILAGHFDDAGTWLKRCLDRRPDDPVIWRAASTWRWRARTSPILGGCGGSCRVRIAPTGGSRRAPLVAGLPRCATPRPSDGNRPGWSSSNRSPPRPSNA